MNKDTDRAKYPYRAYHLRQETDWVLTYGEGNLRQCGLPINIVVLNTLSELIGRDAQLVFNFSQKDCPEYRQYMQEAERIASLNAIKMVVSGHENDLESLTKDPEFQALCQKAGIYCTNAYTVRTLDDWIDESKSYMNNLPCASDDGSALHFPLTDIDHAIRFLITYAFYKSLIRVPYEDSAADELPTIEAVMIDGDPTTIFDDLLHYIYDTAFDKTIADGNGEYYFILHKSKPKYKIHPGIIPSPKKIKDAYVHYFIGIGGVGNPLYVLMSRREYKAAYRTRSIECTLNLYRTEDFKQSRINGTDLHEIGNDYLYSGTAHITDVIYFAIAFPYLISIIIGRLQQDERDLVVGYDTVMYSKVNGELVPSHIKTEYATIERLNQIWFQLTHKSITYTRR